MGHKFNPATGELQLVPPRGVVLFDVTKYGATGDGVTDDADAINDANTAAALVGGTVYFPPGTYLIESTVTFTTHVSGFQAQINTVDDITAVLLGSASGVISKKYFDLPAVRNTSKVSTGWSGSSVGVRAENVQSCFIRFPEIRGFVTGLYQTASGGRGNVYNRVELGVLYDNQVQQKLGPADATSWVNENLCTGGRFLFNNAEGTAVSGTRNIQLETFADASAHLINNNTWLHASLEGDVPEYHVDCLGGWNYWRDCRWEATTPKVNLRSYSSSKYAQRNAVQGGYNSESIVYTEDSNAKFNIFSDDCMYRDLTVTHAQFLTLNGSPLTIVPAPGGGKTFAVLGMVGRFNYGGSAAYTHAGSVICSYAGSTALTQATVGSANFHTATASATKFGGAASNINCRENDALVIFASAANPTGGNANNSFKFRVYYRIIPMTL